GYCQIPVRLSSCIGRRRLAEAGALPNVILRSTTMANPFVHVELNTTDTAAAKAFYAQLSEWQLADMPMPNGTYTMIKVGDGTGGGIVKHPMPGAPSMWLAYVLVDDIE